MVSPRSLPHPSRALAQARSLIRKPIPRDGNLPIWPATDSQRFACLPIASKGCRSMAVSTWLAQRNEKARARLMRNLPEVFPGAVLVHALSRPFLPATPRRTVDSYWRYHPIRADKLARALAALSGAPEGWVWRAGIQKSEPLVSFRVPPTHFANRPIRRAPAIVVCAGSPYFGSAGIAISGATGAQIRTLHGTVVVLRLGTYGLRRAIMSGT
jgi:hypothetical protein